MGFDLDAIKNDFPRLKCIYLNNASSAPMPLVSIKAVTDFLIEYNEYGPDSSKMQDIIDDLINNTRKEVAELINCKADEVVFTHSTTEGINFVANGLNLRQGDSIIIRDGEHEHPANYYAWLRLKYRGVSVKNLSIKDMYGNIDYEELRSIVGSIHGVKLIALSHALFNTGLILPIEDIVNIVIKEQNSSSIHLFLDAAQSVGCVEVDVKRLGCSFMAFTASKWLCGPPGLGVLYCSKDVSDSIEPIIIGGESAFIHEGSLIYKEMPHKLQAGFRSYALLAAFLESVRYIKRIGIAKIRNWNMYLADSIVDGLSSHSKIKLYVPDDNSRRTSIVSFEVSNADSSKVVKELERHGVVVAERSILDKKVIRVSPHFFNSEDEISKFITMLKAILS
jgi:cysteine desulfurase/selenocysteine lyase